jgi:hypothetical protein
MKKQQRGGNADKLPPLSFCSPMNNLKHLNTIHYYYLQLLIYYLPFMKNNKGAATTTLP